MLTPTSAAPIASEAVNALGQERGTVPAGTQPNSDEAVFQQKIAGRRELFRGLPAF